MISKEEILNLAELARLKLSDTELESLQQDISSILEYVGQVSASEPAAAEAPALRNVMRGDTPRSEGDLMAGKEAALRAAFPKRAPAPAGEGEFNVVRKIIQKDE